MKHFHLIVATPHQAKPHELHRVQYHEFIVVADALQNAFQNIRDQSFPVVVATATEVWGSEFMIEADGIVARPISRFQVDVSYDQHLHWCRAQDRYTLVHKGLESFEQWTDRMFKEYRRSHHAQPDCVSSSS